MNAALPFGWKESAFIYHSTSLVASSFIRKLGIPCSLYIDDRLSGELVSGVVSWSVPPAKEIVILVLELLKLRFTSFVTFLLIWGIFLGLAKSVLQLSTRITYLGLVVDTSAQAFFLPQDKVVKFAKLSEAILASKKVIAVKTL